MNQNENSNQGAEHVNVTENTMNESQNAAMVSVESNPSSETVTMDKADRLTLIARSCESRRMDRVDHLQDGERAINASDISCLNLETHNAQGVLLLSKSGRITHILSGDEIEDSKSILRAIRASNRIVYQCGLNALMEFRVVDGGLGFVAVRWIQRGHSTVADEAFSYEKGGSCLVFEDADSLWRILEDNCVSGLAHLSNLEAGYNRNGFSTVRHEGSTVRFLSEKDMSRTQIQKWDFQVDSIGDFYYDDSHDEADKPIYTERGSHNETYAEDIADEAARMRRNGIDIHDNGGRTELDDDIAIICAWLREKERSAEIAIESQRAEIEAANKTLFAGKDADEVDAPEIKRGRGRPRMTEQQKSERAIQRMLEKGNECSAKKLRGIAPQWPSEGAMQLRGIRTMADQRGRK